jgi:hypothetical protein
MGFADLLTKKSLEHWRNGKGEPRQVLHTAKRFSPLSDIPSSGIFRVVGGDLAPSLRFIEENSEY